MVTGVQTCALPISIDDGPGAGDPATIDPEITTTQAAEAAHAAAAAAEADAETEAAPS